jgi:hypothetical protein
MQKNRDGSYCAKYILKDVNPKRIYTILSKLSAHLCLSFFSYIKLLVRDIANLNDSFSLFNLCKSLPLLCLLDMLI